MTAGSEEHIYIGKIVYVVTVKRFPYKNTTQELGTKSKTDRETGLSYFSGYELRTDTAD